MEKSKYLIFAILLLGPIAFGQQVIRVSDTFESTGYEVSNLEALNSSELDYCAVPFRNGVVFTSTRNNSLNFGCKPGEGRQSYSDLYFSSGNAGEDYQSPELMTGNINGKFHDGAATFSREGTEMFFSRNKRQGKHPGGMIDLKIFKAEWANNRWSNSIELPFNSDEYATCHPSLTRKGNWLFFSSDRPGGYGGMDIYVSERKTDGWGNPVNLGPKVNSSGNEIFPFISKEGILYWASDGLPGMGGLDIFSLPVSNGEAAVREHLTPPINSQWDDFAFSVMENGKTGFLTSDRPGGKGKDDIYAWKFFGEKPVEIPVCVTDKQSGERIQDALLLIRPVDGENEGTASLNGTPVLQIRATDEAGKPHLVLVPFEESDLAAAGGSSGESCGISYPVRAGSMYRVKIEKPGYAPYLETVDGHDILENTEWLIPIDKMGPLAIKGKVKDVLDETPIPDADVKVFNACSNETMELVADKNGEFSFLVDCFCDYEITASKGQYNYDFEVLYSNSEPCQKDDATVILYLEKSWEDIPDENSLEVGAVITLDNLYYDYDKYNIRPDAARELDHVVDLMKRYPSLEIELGSHTDSRGSDTYNQKLSQQRAQAAVEYIVTQGISRNRLKAMGYGEKMLVNRCNNNAECPEEEHQENRRTEVTVTKIDEENVKVRGH